jgi:hypothetical protein
VLATEIPKKTNRYSITGMLIQRGLDTGFTMLAIEIVLKSM